MMRFLLLPAAAVVMQQAAPAANRVAGTVSDAATGRPIAGARVSAPQWGVEGETDSAGAYVLRLPRAGRFVVRATAPGYAASAPLTARVGTRPATLDLALRAPGADETLACEVEASAAGSSRARLAASWTPERPRAGTPFSIRLRVDASASGVVAAHGTVAGAPLAFERTSSGELHAIGAVPVDSARAPLRVSVTLADGARLTLEKSVEATSGDYALERLSVAPSFGAPPDADTRRRQAAEAALAGEVGERSARTVRLWREPFALPRDSRITSAFGGGRVFNGRVQSRHTGTDFAGAVGTPVRSANRGVVALVADFRLAGTAVYIDHGAGVSTAYFHLSRVDVAPGDTVSRGQLIGGVGATGRVTGPHLHWVARIGGTSVDPLELPELAVPGGEAVPACAPVAGTRD